MPDPPPTGRIIRVLVVDDHPVVRQGLRSFLDTRAGIEVVGEAADGDQAAELAATLRPDVVLLDLVMPGGGGLAAIGRIAEMVPGAKVLVLTSFSSDDQVIPAIRAGAAGYLLKDAHPSQVEDAVRTVARGERFLDPQVTAVVMAEVAQPRSSGGPGGPQALSLLTPRETQVLALLGEGLSNRDLAARLFVSEKTVKTHVSSILSKLGVADRTQAALVAARLGLAGTGS
jgi:DNA-binding NarL/FixJ family response regulator